MNCSAAIRSFLWFAIIGAMTSGLGAPMVAGDEWKAGAAMTAITPKESMWMAGYGARNHPSEGVVHDLWAKALAFQDPSGQKAVIVTLDVCGIDRDLSNIIRDAIESRLGLKREQIVLATSHTHSGPVVGRNLYTMYPLDDVQKEKVRDYTRFFAETVNLTVDRAFANMEIVKIGWGTGRADFAVNRRNNGEGDFLARQEKLAVAGPTDHDVPVLRVQSLEDKLLAVVFSYACHCTVLDEYKFCGDYAGFAQVELQSKYPGAQAMFVAGCGADQNPIPRRNLALAEKYGKELAQSVSAVVEQKLPVIEGPIRAGYEETDLAFQKLPTKEEVEQDAKSENFYVSSRAKHLLEQFAARGKLPADYPYPVQVWRLDNLNWIFLGGEVTVDYSLQIKRSLGSSHTWVAGYCNDVMAYIPSLRVLKEGGYEGGGAMLYYGLPSPWSDKVEESVLAAVARLLSLTATK